jgi:peptidyl-prolyl cis-trans isomerase SurA
MRVAIGTEYALDMRWRWLLPVVSIALASVPLASASPSPKSVGLVDRIMAVVGYECILLSELRTRARPYTAQLDASGKTGAAKAAAESQLYREVLDKMIDEHLIAAEADRSKIAVTSAEIDTAMKSVATTQGLTIPKLLEAAKASGFSEKEYREELRRQLLEGKVLQLKVIPRIKGYSALSEDARTKRLDQERAKYLQELRTASYVEVRL